MAKQLKPCSHCRKFFVRLRCSALTHGECDCPKCQGYCTCPPKPAIAQAEAAGIESNQGE